MSFLSQPLVTSLPVDFDPFAGGELSSTVPLTASQKEIWASVQMGSAANCSYNESQSLELKGGLSENAILQALQALIARHEILRATCSPDGSTLCIARELALDIAITDLSHLDHEVQTQQITNCSQQAVRTTFDLEHGPLIRGQLIKLTDQDHVLLLTVHHIICDGWSIALMISDLAKLYTDFKRGKVPQLNPPNAFSDYAIALDDAKETSAAKEDFDYWLNQYGESVPTLDFPTDRPRPALRTFDSARVDWQLSPDLTTRLKHLGTELGGSFMTTLLSGFEIYLARITGQSDITVGVPAAGQAATGEFNLVGHCVNLLPLRSQVHSQHSFQEYFNHRKSTVLDAYDHQQFTFGTLVQALKMDRDPSRIPLVPIIFNIDQGLDSEQLSFADLEVTSKSNPRSYENFELFINATELKGAVTLECQYNTNLFDRETIQRRLAEFETILRSIITNPAQPISTLSLLPESERQWLAQFNPTQTPGLDSLCLHQLVETQTTKAPNTVAVIFEDTQLTYQALDHQANQLAHFLRKQGVGPDCLVGLCLERSLNMVVAMLAILKAGGAYVPLDPGNPPHRLALILEDSQLSLLISETSLETHIPDCAASVIYLDQNKSQIESEPTAPVQNTANTANMAYVLYTSGSTGKPKGVMIAHCNVVNLLQAMGQELYYSSSDICLAVTPISFDISVLEIFLPLIKGGKVVIASREVAQDGNRLLFLLTNTDATFMQATPATWQMLLTVGWQGNQHLKILSGGEAMSHELAQALNQRSRGVWNGYGPTEATIYSTVYPLSTTNSDTITVPIGRPLLNTGVCILDAHSQPVPRGVPGELCLVGAGLGRGYLNRSSLTAEKFCDWPEAGAEQGQRMYKTGDWVRLLPDGNIEWLGRIDHQIKIRGFRIEIGEIEANLRQFPTVKEAVVLVREDTPGERILVGYFVGQDAQTQGIATWVTDIRQFLKSRVPDFMVPNHFMPLETFPLTSSGKIDRKALPKPDTSQMLAANYVAPRNSLEEQIMQVWAEIFKQEKIGIYDNFFDLGGYSLLAVQIVSRLRQALNIEILLPHLFESPTIAELAQRVEVLRWSIHGQPEQDTDDNHDGFEEGEL
ncbi:non-ribosomal peptide synthetase [Acaryochloris marina]|uniref:non-ribosomal peptide synthetase n=1 Tax=Acaryochloris marina TaxID=155978 RepID=UPI001BB0A980|nr:non-ribosomal peptide synthetase [Acaryochloris marina]QUY44989.1 amino acid adenylation domain-containing protein [Acaryochloris marina S15]